MTADEAVEALDGILELVRKRRPDDTGTIHTLLELQDFFASMGDQTIVIGKIGTNEIRAIDPRIWRTEEVEWIDERKPKRKEVREDNPQGC